MSYSPVMKVRTTLLFLFLMCVVSAAAEAQVFWPRVPASPAQVESLVAATTPSGKMLSPSETRKTIVRTEWPTTPMKRVQGPIRQQIGVFLLTVRPDGSVARVEILHSTGEGFFDTEFRRAFAKWQFKPGSVEEVRVPAYFNSSRWSYRAPLGKK